jgi:competence ComEA-like helix-hairpin-helix protein
MRPGSVAALALLVGWLALAALATHSPEPAVVEVPAAAPVRRSTEAPSSAALVALRKGQPIDLNAATLGDLELLPGVGPKLAQRIAEARAARGGAFASIADLQAVSGIGPAKLEQIASAACVGAACRAACKEASCPQGSSTKTADSVLTK